MARTEAPARVTEGVVARSARTLAAGVIPGWVAGSVAGGVGARLAMRVLAMTTPEASGRLTEAGATVGEITAGGTLFLLATGTLLGGWGGVAYLALRRWLPGRGWKRGLAFGLPLMLVTGAGLVSADNPDFRLLRPASLAVAMFLALPMLYGLVLVPLVDRVEPRIHAFRHPVVLAVPVVLGLIPLALVGPTGVSILLLGAVAFFGRGSLDRRELRIARLSGLALLAGLVLWRAADLVREVTGIL